MAESEKDLEISSKKKSSSSSSSSASSILNRSFTMQATPSADSHPKINYASLNRAMSINKFYNSMESVVLARNSFIGKVKQLCSLFEPKKSSSKPKNNNIIEPAMKITKPPTLVKSLSYNNESFIRLLGTEDRIVVYLTSFRGIRRTYEDCYAVRTIFRGFRVWVDERDISMDFSYKKELHTVFGGKNVSLPQVFIRGKYVGNADVIKGMFETGELVKVLDGFPRRQAGFVCGSCGDVRFVLCLNCNGSRKLFDDDDGVLKRCLECNENGLIRCPECCL